MPEGAGRCYGRLDLAARPAEPVEIAALRNNAGIVGAALWAQQCRGAQAAKPVIDPVD